MNLNNLVHELALESGFSYNITTGECNPKAGYMVSLLGFEEQYYFDDFDNKDLKNFVAKNAIHLHNDNRFVGGWINDNKVYLDISINVEDLESAVYIGMHNNQKAIFDCANNKAITLPSPQRSGTMTQNKTYNEMKAKQLAFLIETTGVE